MNKYLVVGFIFFFSVFLMAITVSANTGVTNELPPGIVVTPSSQDVNLFPDVASTLSKRRNYLPIVNTALFPPDSPTLNTISNSDQDNRYDVSWSAVQSAASYILQESTDSLFSYPAAVYQGNGLNWTVPGAGKKPSLYFYRVKAINKAGESPWSNFQQIAIHPLFIGLDLRWDGNGYVRGYNNYDIGYHLTSSLDQLSSGYIIRSNNHDWYSPNPIGWEDSYWYSFFDITTGVSLSSSKPPNPDWKWGYDWILPYNLQFDAGQTIDIDEQAFLISGPTDGYTAFGAPVRYWQFTNKDQFIYFDNGEDQQYVYPGEAILRYDAGNTRLNIYNNVKRHIYSGGDDLGISVQYINVLTAANSFTSGAQEIVPYPEGIAEETNPLSDKNMDDAWLIHDFNELLSPDPAH